MKRIVVGADGSQAAAFAMGWASRLASQLGAEIVMMTGFVPDAADPSPEQLEQLLAEQQQKLEGWTSAAKLGGTNVRYVVEQGDPRQGIVQVAEREEADLVVVGRVGRSAGPGLFNIGSMAEWLAHHVNRPLAVVSATPTTNVSSLLLAVDGSPKSASALGWVHRLAEISDMRIVVASVRQPYLEWTPSDSPKNWRRDLEKEIRHDFANDLTSAGVVFRALALAGSNVSDALVQAAKDERIDTIVLGTRGLGGLSGLRIGGVSLKTLHQTDRTVVLVPAES